MRPMIRSLAALAFAAGVPALGQDLTIVSKVMKDGKPAETTTSYLSRDYVRSAQGDGKESIYDLKAGQMTVLDGTKKTYYVITRQDMEQVAARMKEQMNSPEAKKAQERMKSLSPEEQQKMDAMMGGMFDFDVQKTGTTRRIAGYNCENWKITLGRFSKTEECLTSELQFPAQAWEMYKGFAENMKTMMAAFGPMARSMEKMQEKFKTMRGFPLATTTEINIMGHATTSVSEVTEVKRGPIPASAWEIPAGYTKVDNPMLKAGRPGRTPRR
jgi:Domain of unknown function (DUF4412)